jgi:hypothetical protein
MDTASVAVSIVMLPFTAFLLYAPLHINGTPHGFLKRVALKGSALLGCPTTGHRVNG